MGDSPWNGIGQRYQRGHSLKGRVTATETYGIYVEVEPGIEGLAQVGPDGLAEAAFDVGDEIGVIVLEVDESQRLIRLGVVQ